MSEHHPSRTEHNSEQLKPAESHEHHSGRQEHEVSAVEKEHGNQEHVQKLARQAEQHAVSGKELSHKKEHRAPGPHPVLVNKQLKDIAFVRTMTRTRKKLHPTDRVLSKLIHNPVIDRPSDFLGKTLARPASMFWGALFAFIGTSVLLWITRHYGYEYNYFLALVLFVIGAVFGVLLEGLVYFLRRKSR